jgi:hypothetical protein
MTEVSEQQQLRELCEEAERTRDDPYPPDTRWTRPGLARAKVLTLRLNPEEMDELNRYAAALEAPVSVLVRGWILQRLRAAEEDSPAAAVERIGLEVERLRRQLRAG